MSQFERDALAGDKSSYQIGAERGAQETRQVLYDGVIEFIAHEFAAGAGRHMRNSSDERALTEIHSQWLLAGRKELHGAAPRDVLLERRELIDRDLQCRRDQWCQCEGCPTGLSRDSAAFRCGGYGSHEIVLYYDLVRHLLRDCAQHLNQGGAVDLSAEIERLRQVRDKWLNSSTNSLLEGYTPAVVIDSERRRVPLAVAGEEAMIDCNCPLCQMMVESGPVFLHLDGCHLDNEFAFSFHATREQWQREQDEWKQEAEQWEHERALATAGRSPWQEAFWSDCMVDATESPEFKLIAIAACLAELGLDLKELEGTAPQVDGLNRQFGNLREVARRGPRFLLQPVVDKLSEELQEVSESRSELSGKCLDLQSRLAAFVRDLDGLPRSTA